MEPIAVLTGDLIASTKAEGAAVDRAMQTLARAARMIGGWAGHDTRFTRFRGDGWQIYLARPGLVLRAMLFLTAYMRAADTGLATRMAIAIAPYDRLGEAGLSGASGLAFERSGRELDRMRRHDTLAFAAGPAAWEPWQGAVLTLAEWQAGRWTREQAEAMAMALDPLAPTQDQIAQSLGITRQAVQARLKGAGLAALHAALAAFEMEPP
ncbi:hypothetical protein GC209_12125 [bacterium]|nr:hypothetical protein [bacterium]